MRRVASIEGVRFRCSLQGASRLYVLLTHRNLWRAGWRLKRAFRFRKFFGYFLPKKVTTRNNLQTLYSVCVTVWTVTPQCWAGWRDGSPARRLLRAGLPSGVFFSSTKLHEGHEEGMRRFGFFASFRMTVRVWRSFLCCRELTDTLAVSPAVTAAAHDGEVPTGPLRTASSGRKCSSQNSFVPRRFCLPSHPPPLRQVPAGVS